MNTITSFIAKPYHISGFTYSFAAPELFLPPETVQHIDQSHSPIPGNPSDSAYRHTIPSPCFPNVRDNPFLEIGIADRLPTPDIPEFQRIGINRSLFSVKHCHNNSIIRCSRRSGKLQTHTNFFIYSHITAASDICCIFAVSGHTKHLF